MKTFVLAVTLFLVAIGLPAIATGNYKCSVTWYVGTFNGTGSTLNEAVKEARHGCNDHEDLGNQECGSAPQHVNCLDRHGKCVSRAEFLRHGMVGGDKCQ